ncbi:MAG: Uma2 family endonuclease [Oscillospiraceae bacterium]|jgi:Uma2 family endonuclease|nr:Uma2 family endonuclease [Oscillospiraceae bacterium]
MIIVEVFNMPQEIEITEELDNRLIITTTHGEDRDFELINGVEVEVAKPKWFHNFVLVAICNILSNFIKQNKLKNKVMLDGIAVYVDEESEPEPDLVLIEDKSKLDGGVYRGVPELVVEVTSPSTIRRDLNEKSEMYAKLGVPEYWTIQPVEKIITAWYNVSGVFKVNAVYQLPPENPKLTDEGEYLTQIQTRYYGDKLTLDLYEIFYDI